MSDPIPIRFSPARREFLKLSAAAAALATAGCSPPSEEIVPYVKGGEAAAGVPRFFATAMTLGGHATGVLVESNLGRPTKVEGNPAHPASLGATDVFAQASILDLWDPARSRAIRRGEAIVPRTGMEAALRDRLASLEARGGEGLRVLAGYSSSPTFAAQWAALARRFPAARLHTWEALHRDHSLEGSRLAFGRALDALPRFENADVVVAIDADFLASGPGHLRHARDFMARRVASEGRPICRLFVVETALSLTGARADHRAALGPAEVVRWTQSLADVLRGEKGAPLPLVAEAARELLAHRGRALVLAGESLPPEAHALVHQVNASLAAPGSTVGYIERVTGDIACTGSIRDLSADLGAGRVEALVILGGNPAYDAPADLGFAEAIARAPFSLHLGLREDETAARCGWHVPEAHYLEAWSDGRAFDGTASVVQPLIAPLHGGVSCHELMSLLAGASTGGRDAVRAAWSDAHRGDFEPFWRDALREGVIASTAASMVTATARRVDALRVPPQEQETWTLRFAEDAAVRDGAFASNAWLQELPRPDSKIVWDNAAAMSAASAQKLGVAEGDFVEIASGARRVRAPVLIVPGHADGAITLALGYGRTRGSEVGTGVGVDAYALRAGDTPWTLAGVQVSRAAGRHEFARTQRHDEMAGRQPVRCVEARDADRPIEDDLPKDSLYPAWPYESYRWGMAIDLNACIGCNACTIACQAENNIPTVGREQAALGRAMHWIRVDRYFDGPAESPRTLHQPVPCMHCEDAPCEVVCPVGATVHDSEGINVQVYNRCVGTRFCSNNCPYKVRRFNFLAYFDRPGEMPLEGRNPEVTTRMRGVMEKCNYCLQRITRARIEADRDGRRLRDGEVITACQAVCPTRAITFGDLNDPASAVAAAKASPRGYTLLGELNTRPRTTYLARIVDP